MTHARALVMPALWYETQGLVVEEAAALGVPSVVSDGCAASEAVLHGETGLHFRLGSVTELAAALRRLVDDTTLAPRLGQCAYDRFWRDPPTLASHAQDLLRVYQGILSRAGEQART